MQKVLMAFNEVFSGLVGELLLWGLIVIICVPSVVVLIMLDKKIRQIILKYGTFGIKDNTDVGTISSLLITGVVFLIALILLILNQSQLEGKNWIMLLGIAIVIACFFVSKLIFKLVYFLKLKNRVKYMKYVKGEKIVDQQPVQAEEVVKVFDDNQPHYLKANNDCAQQTDTDSKIDSQHSENDSKLSQNADNDIKQ